MPNSPSIRFSLFYRVFKTFRDLVSENTYDALFFRGAEIFFNNVDDETFLRLVHDISCPSCGKLYRVARSTPAWRLINKTDAMDAYFGRLGVSDKARMRAVVVTRQMLKAIATPDFPRPLRGGYHN